MTDLRNVTNTPLYCSQLKEKGRKQLKVDSHFQCDFQSEKIKSKIHVHVSVSSTSTKAHFLSDTMSGTE